ncbi:MAG TPA: hypothetical protein DCO77_03595 [Nitrospiraceae bacterium]|nr:hypothetical protein [Nitrospiraceae bacterium]
MHSMADLTFTYLSELLSFRSQQIYLVGGSVRDLLLGGQAMNDIDLLMPSGSEEVARAFAAAIGGSFFFLDEERRITRVMKHGAGEAVQFDFTNFEGPDLNTDLARRDFTINAMALDLRAFVESGSLTGIIDPFHGREDVKKKLVRAVRPTVLDDDPLRLLRAVRFSAALDFTIEDGTAEEIRKRADLITGPSPERIRDELFQILSSRGAENYLVLMDSLGLLLPVLPELASLKGFRPGRYELHDVLTHSLRTVGHVDGMLDDLFRLSPDHAAPVLDHLEEPLEQLVPRKAALRFACLLHDIAKPETFTETDGHVRFHDHDNRGAEKAREACRRLRLSGAVESMVARVIKYHMRLFNLSAPGGPSRNAVYRYCRDLKDDLPESLMLAQADARATSEIMAKEKFADTERPMAVVLDYYYNRFLKTEEKPLVTGQDLINAGLTPGPRFREILDDIKEKQAEGSIATRRGALDYLDRFK